MTTEQGEIARKRQVSIKTDMPKIVELQSLLLRLSILLATSLSTLSDPLPPTIVDPSSSSLSISAEKLSAQILNDVNVLLKSVQKACTNLALALRPRKSSSKSDNHQQGDNSSSSSSSSPAFGLDSASLDAAKSQLTDLTKDFIPKLTFLSRKASSEAVHFRYISKTKNDVEKEKKERELVKSKGGYIVQHSYSRDYEKLEKIKGKGLGVAWSKAVVSVIVEVQEALGDLSETFMSERTLLVLKKASEARAKAEGAASSSSPSQERELPKNKEQVRQRALQATSVVWDICDAALKGKLPKDNRTAVRQSWKTRTEVLEDALKEFNEAIKEEQDGDDKSETIDDDDDFDDMFQHLSLSKEEKMNAAKYLALIQTGCHLHAKAGELCLGEKQKMGVGEAVDFDDLEDAGVEISEAVDDLVSSLIYGEEQEQDDEEQGEELKVAFAALNESTNKLYLAATSTSNETQNDLQAIQAKLKSLFESLS